MNVREIDYRAGERVEIDCTHLIGATVGACAACIAKALAAAEERGRRRGVEERDKLVLAVQELLRAMEYREKTDAGEYRVAENVIKSAWERAKAEGLAALRALAPRDSGKGEHYDVPCLCGDGSVDPMRCPAHRPGAKVRK